MTDRTDRNEPNEDARLDALYQLNLLDTAPSESFDRVTRMASQLFELPISAVSLTDRDRQWFKSRVGVDHMSIPRERAPCAQVAETTDIVVVPDLLEDPWYADSHLARSGVRFYAGAPLVTREGHGLGALCVLGTEPRAVTERELAALDDLAKIVMAQIELQHAFGRIDPLSGLPNRTQFLDDLEDLARDHPGQRRMAVLVDLARNDQITHGIRVMGPTYIDDMVQEAAKVLRAALGDGRTAYHVAATQFAFLAPPEVAETEYPAMLATKLENLRRGLSVRFVMSPVVGVVPFVLGGMTPRDVLRSAYGASQDARGKESAVSVYSSSSDGVHRRRFELLNEFGAALGMSDQLRLVFQPRIDLASRACLGAEALLRWRHPELGDVSPGEFIPIVERAALAKPTTAWVLETALEQLGAWHRAGLAVVLSVNISSANLEERDFALQVQLLLLKHRVPPAMLELELTESAIMEHAGAALLHLEALAAVGVRLAIDDFGTGYSSLAYLRRLPVHVVKIDQTFVRELDAEGGRERTLVRSMITLSHDLGYRVVAEGVETTAAADALSEMGCDEAQGYLFARPLEKADFEQWFRDNEARDRGRLRA